MSTVASCALFSSRPVLRLAYSGVGRLPSMTPAATAPLSSRRRSRPLAVYCVNNPTKGEHNPKTDLHAFNISPVALVHPVTPREERWQLKEESGKVDLWFEVPGQTKENLAVEIDEDVLVIKKRIKTPTADVAEQGSPTGNRAAPDGDVIYARLLLPAGYSKEGVAAELKSGVLTVSIPKIKEKARRKMDIDVDVK